MNFVVNLKRDICNPQLPPGTYTTELNFLQLNLIVTELPKQIQLNDFDRMVLYPNPMPKIFQGQVKCCNIFDRSAIDVAKWN